MEIGRETKTRHSSIEREAFGIRADQRNHLLSHVNIISITVNINGLLLIMVGWGQRLLVYWFLCFLFDFKKKDRGSTSSVPISDLRSLELQVEPDSRRLALRPPSPQMFA